MCQLLKGARKGRLSALLLFQVRSIIGKSILTWFGGSPAVWTSVVVFQTLLFAG